MNTKIRRLIKIDVTPPPDSEEHPSEAFYEVSKKYGRKLDMKDIKRALEERF
jgi:hypothetical protein